MPKANSQPRPRSRDRAHRRHDDSRRDHHHRDRDAPRRRPDYSIAAFAHHLEPTPTTHHQPERRHSDTREDGRNAGEEVRSIFRETHIPAQFVQRDGGPDTHRQREAERTMSSIFREVGPICPTLLLIPRACYRRPHIRFQKCTFLEPPRMHTLMLHPNLTERAMTMEVTIATITQGHLA